MLKLFRVFGRDGDDRPIDVEFSHYRNAIFQFRSKCVIGTLPQAQQTNQNVLRRGNVKQKNRFSTFTLEGVKTKK